MNAMPEATGSLVPDPADLVERALALLAEETDMWNARRTASLSPGNPP